MSLLNRIFGKKEDDYDNKFEPEKVETKVKELTYEVVVHKYKVIFTTCSGKTDNITKIAQSLDKEGKLAGNSLDAEDISSNHLQFIPPLYPGSDFGYQLVFVENYDERTEPIYFWDNIESYEQSTLATYHITVDVEETFEKVNSRFFDQDWSFDSRQIISIDVEEVKPE